jgi:hypothetical protein
MVQKIKTFAKDNMEQFNTTTPYLRAKLRV